MTIKLLPLLLILLLGGSGPSTAFAQAFPDRPLGGQGAAAESAAPAKPKTAPPKTSSGQSPKQQIKEGGREIGQGFKNLGLAIGRGFKNMGLAIKKAWTGGKEN